MSATWPSRIVRRVLLTLYWWNWRWYNCKKNDFCSFMCLITVKPEFCPRDDHHELLHLSPLFCELTAVMIHTFRLLGHSIELNACQRCWLVLCSLTLSLSSPQPWSKCFTTTQQIILDELSSTRRQIRSSCVTLCHNTPSSFSQPWIYHSNEQSRYMEH